MSDKIIQSQSVKNKLIKEVYHACGGNQKKIHKLVCDMNGRKCEDVNMSSLYNRVKNVSTTIKRLKNARNPTKLNEYENMVFKFPVPMKRKSDVQVYKGNVNKLWQQHCDLQSKYMTCNQKLYDIQTKEKGLNSLVSVLNQKIKRQQNTIVRLRSLLRAEKKK